MRLWYLSHRRTAKAQARLRICAVSPEPSLFAHIKYGSRWRVWPKSDSGLLHMRVWRLSLQRAIRTIIWLAGLNVKSAVMILSFRTDRRSSLIRVYTVCHSVCFFLTHYSVVKWYCSKIRIVTAIFFGCPNFKEFYGTAEKNWIDSQEEALAGP